VNILAVATLRVDTLAPVETFRAATLATVRLEVDTLVVAAKSDAKLLAPETFKVVKLLLNMFAVEPTLRVVEFIKGIVSVSKLNVVFVAFDVMPAV
jgi:hypothetical protein